MIVRFLWLTMLLTLASCTEKPQPVTQDAIELLSQTPPEGFERATTVRTFNFPADHGTHPGFRTEWWYLTGHLFSAGQRFGYQVTFFRFALTPDNAETEGWNSQAIWLGQAALSDITGQRFFNAERFSRELPQLAGAATNRLDVEVEGWQLKQEADQYKLQIRTGQFELALNLDPVKPVVLQGDRGLSQKSAEAGNASYYYSQPRLRSSGQVTLNGQSYPVNGLSWFDREWSTSALGPKQAGWDWFALQLDNGDDLMFYRLRLEDGESDPQSSGVWVAANGQTSKLTVTDVRIEALDDWLSPQTGIRYPAGWRLTVPSLELDLNVQPLLADQEWHDRFNYWEGAVDIQGKIGQQPLGGQGYVELTGY